MKTHQKKSKLKSLRRLFPDKDIHTKNHFFHFRAIFCYLHLVFCNEKMIKKFKKKSEITRDRHARFQDEIFIG